jgi:hypothetical protein
MISKNMVRCIAHLSGDGNVYHRYLRYNNTSTTLLNLFEKDIIKEFGNIPITKGTGNSGTSFIQVNRKLVIEKFLTFLPSYKSGDIYVPDEIKNGNKENKIEYLKALYDDEGSVALRIAKKTNEWKRNITLSSNSLRILLEIKEILQNDFQIKSNKIYRNKPNSKTDISYVLSISGLKNITNFIDIGFNHKKKQLLLELMIESYGNTYNRNFEGFNKIKKKLDLIKKG